MNGIEKQISEAFLSFPKIAKANGWKSRSHWTGEIKNMLCRIGRDSHGYTVVANGCTEIVIDEEKSEWLYDLTWQKKDADNYLSGLAMAMESEWEPDPDGDNDFEKLIQCRADLRLWIIRERDEDSLRDHFHKCIDMIRRFEGSILGDRYLFAGYSIQEGKFIVQQYSYVGHEIKIPREDIPAFLKGLPD